jgi:hypothetical protein
MLYDYYELLIIIFKAQNLNCHTSVENNFLDTTTVLPRKQLSDYYSNSSAKSH